MLPRVDLIKTEDASWLLMNSPDYITAAIKKDGAWGTIESSICRVFLRGLRHPIVIDAGANIGSFAVPIAQTLMQQNGKLYCFEPQRIVFQQLCANLFVNRIDNVHAHNTALGETAGSVDIPELDFEHSQNVGGFSIDETIRGKISKSSAQGATPANKLRDDLPGYRVEKRTLDSFSIAKDIAFIKADVEGYELEFFQGAVNTLKNNGFPPIFFELWQNLDWYAEKAARTTKFLSDLGYEFENFGIETLAQHPANPAKVLIKKQGGRAKLVLKR